MGKAMVDAGRLADELRAEQDHTQAQEKAIRTIEVTMSELKRKAEEAAIQAARSAAVTPAKLEAKAQEIEFELNRTIQKTAEVHKGNTAGERTVKELLFQQEENNKKQIEEAEEIAAINLAKFRKAQQDLEEAEERSRMAEQSVSKYQQARGMSCTPGL